MPTAIEFYRDALGFAVIATCNPGPNFGWVLLCLNGVELMLNTAYEAAERPLVPDPARKAAHRDTANIFCMPERGCRLRLLARRGHCLPGGRKPRHME